MKERHDHWAYLLIVFVLSYLWQWVIYLTGGVESPLFPFVMLIPGGVAIGFWLVRKRGLRNVGWGLGRAWYVIPALVVPIVVVLASAWILTSFHWATFSSEHFRFENGTVEIHKIPFILGNKAQGTLYFAVNFLCSLFVQSLLGSIVTIGEELGWRGYLQSRLIERFGTNWGLIVLGVFWGYWHLPIILMGYNFPTNPVLGATVLMPLFTIFAGIFLGWLYLRSKSIWMPAVAHAAMNLTGVLLLTEVIMQREELLLRLVFIASWGVVAALCLVSLNVRRPVIWQAATPIPGGGGGRTNSGLGE